MHIVIATLETPNFRLETVGATEAKAMELIEGAWSCHFDEMGRPGDMLLFDSVLGTAKRPDSRYFVTSRSLQVGSAYRDGQQPCLAEVVAA